MNAKSHRPDLTGLRVSNLFGRFDHELKFTPEDDVSIITAPNGFGKTVLLRILDALFNRKLTFFRRLDFSTIEVSMGDSQRISVSKSGQEDSKSGATKVEFSGRGFGSRSNKYTLARNVSRFEYRFLERNLPVESIGPDRWLDLNTEQVLSTEQLAETYSDHLPARIRESFEMPDWLQEAIGSVTVHLVETQRLLHLDKTEDRRSPRRRRVLPAPVVERDALDLSGRIGRLLQQYANESQQLDQTFPERILKLRRGAVSSEAEIRDVLSTLTQKRGDLISVGLLGKTISEPIRPSESLQQETIRRILEIYIEDTKKKLSIFDETYETIELFKQILEKRFSYKRIEIDPQYGMRAIDTETNLEIPLSELSSGEQHELVLLYELIFTVEENSLILIDEPELSLHVSWQKQFISDLERIQEIKRLRVIIATHSPQIIHNKWNLVQELSKQVNDKHPRG